MSAVRGFAEVVLNVTDLDASVDWYRRVLGFAVHAEWPEAGAATIVFLRVGDARRDGAAHPPLLALIDPVRHEPAHGKFDVVSPRSSTLNHVAFDIDAADAAGEKSRLEGLGVEVMEVAFGWMGARALFMKDPDGNSVELIWRDG